MKRIVLWPSYFDIKVSKKRGRRLSKNLAVEAPTVEEVVAAAKTMGLDPEVEYSKAFPSAPWVKGRVFVSKTNSKQEIIRKIGTVLKRRRRGQS